VLYSGHRYGWDAQMIGFTLAGAGVANVIVQAVLIRRVTPAIGERRTMMLGLVAGIAGFLIYGLAPTGPWFWAGLPVAALMGFFTPALQALMTRHVSPQEQGQLQGANGSIAAIVGLAAPGTFSYVFARGIDPLSGWNLPGVSMLLASFTLACALVLAWRVTRSEG
jgi:DHA1 family tetracycline resistance protein-like MFS transporter